MAVKQFSSDTGSWLDHATGMAVGWSTNRALQEPTQVKMVVMTDFFFFFFGRMVSQCLFIVMLIAQRLLGYSTRTKSPTIIQRKRRVRNVQLLGMAI